MYVIKRNGTRENVQFDKITERIRKLSTGLNVQPEKVAQKTLADIYDGITTTQLDTVSADIASNMSTMEKDYDTLAVRIYVSNMHKTFPLPNEPFVDNDRDNDFTYFGLKTMEKIYLQKNETPQAMFLRVARAIHGSDQVNVEKTYEMLSLKQAIHATPTMINAGSKNQQMSSCFLTKIKDDSMDGIYKTLRDCALISKHGGGIGIHAQHIRSKGSRIKTSDDGKSDGIIPMLRVFNSTARYSNQNGKRKGSFAIYLEPWHPDIFDFLELRLNQGDEEARCRDLFLAMWIPDLFMKCVEQNGDWYLFDPDECPGLSDTYGKDFEELYNRYVEEGRERKVVPSALIWKAILKSQIETGTPYIMYKDTCNLRSNQKNLGTLTGSNLCSEILEYTDAEEISVCNLASISLPSCVSKYAFDFDQLYTVTKQLTVNLNRIIDANFYPVKEAKTSNEKHRPIGIGVQGLADVFMMLGYPYGSEESRKLNSRIFETIYYAALEASSELARVHGPYESYAGSPASQGLLQFDLAGATFEPHYDWDALRQKIKTNGLYNSLLIAPMPTATTSQVLGNNECFEPYTTNIYIRRTLAGEFTIVNKHLVQDLQDIGLWSENMKNAIIRNGGSVQDISGLPQRLKDLYKTAWEISPRVLIDMARDRGIFVCQSQSMNLYVEDTSKLSSIHMYGWKQGLKTGSYYIHTRPKASAIQVTIEPQVCRYEPGCLSCGS